MKDISFKEIRIEDKEQLEFILHKYSAFCLSAFTFASLIAWARVYNYQWAIFNDTLLIQLTTLEDNKKHFLQPVGEFPQKLQNSIVDYAFSLDYRLTIFGVSDAFIHNYPQFISHFERTEHRDMDNYIYSTEDLALLKGKKFQPKRNLLNQFETNYNWTSEPISAENIPACLELINKIYNQNELDTDSYLAHEIKALDFVLNNFSTLKQQGILIRVTNIPVALSIYEHLNPSTYVVHFEKAIREYKGLYQLINRETAKIILSKGRKYINREEDLGIEGLRKAKLSYHPLELCPAHALVFKK